MSLKESIKNQILKLSLKLPASRGALLEHRCELKEMLEIVKEIEAMNRTDISNLLITMGELKKKAKISNKKDEILDVNIQ